MSSCTPLAKSCFSPCCAQDGVVKRHPILTAIVAISIAAVLFLLIQPYLAPNEKLILGCSASGCGVVLGFIYIATSPKPIARWITLFGSKEAYEKISRIERHVYAMDKDAQPAVLRLPRTIAPDDQNEDLIIRVKKAGRTHVLTIPSNGGPISSAPKLPEINSNDQLRRILKGETVDKVSLDKAIPGGPEITIEPNEMDRALKEFHVNSRFQIVTVTRSELTAFAAKLDSRREAILRGPASDDDDTQEELVIRVKKENKSYCIRFTLPACIVDNVDGVLIDKNKLANLLQGGACQGVKIA